MVFYEPKLHCWCTNSRLVEAVAQLSQKYQNEKDWEQKLMAMDQELQEKVEEVKAANEEREATTQQWGHMSNQ